MLIVAKKTEENLLSALQSYEKISTDQKCFYVALSKIDMPSKPLFEEFLQCLHNIPNTYMAQVFICKDRDIFIIMSGFMQRHFINFLNAFSNTIQTPLLTELSAVYDLDNQSHELVQMCQYKIDIIARQSAKATAQQRKEDARKAALETLRTLDISMIETIQVRRTERRAPAVLIVDDDQLSRTLAGNVLREDYQTFFAKDGQGALEEYVACAPDAVFLDIGMPDISGHEVLETLFQVDPDAYVIMFSGRKDQHNMMRALETGAQGFLGKPFTREKLYGYVDQSPFVQSKKSASPVSKSVQV